MQQQRLLRVIDLSCLLLLLSTAAPSLQEQIKRPHEGASRRERGTNKEKLVERFSNIYETKFWGEEGRGSGPGSTRLATLVTVSIIRSIFAKYDLRSLLDAPCGITHHSLISHL